MLWAQLASSVLAETNWVPVFLIAVFLVVWGVAAMSKFKAAATKPTGPRAAPLPLPPGRTNVRVPPPLPRTLTKVALPQATRRPAAQKPTKPRAVQSVKPPLPPPVAPTPATISSPSQVRSAVSSWINIKTLRSEFLLAEALKPPIALRMDPFTSK